MRLVLNCERPLTQVAMNAVMGTPAPSTAGPARTHHGAGVDAWNGMEGDMRMDEPSTLKLESWIRTLVVGEAAQLDQLLAANAAGWSPSGSFARRDEAVELAQQPLSSLAVDTFHVETLCWCTPVLFAGWSLLARQVDALLLYEDILLEATGRTVGLDGTTVARIEAEKVVHTITHFDDAEVIEQVILGR